MVEPVDAQRTSAAGGPDGAGSDLRRLVLSAWISNLGDGVRLAALPLLTLSIDGSATAVTLVIAASLLPMLLFGLHAGVLADRRARVPLVVGAHALRSVALLGLLGLLAVDELTLPALIIVAACLGIGETIADSAVPGMVDDILDDDSFEDAHGRLQAAEYTANDLVGPIFGALLYAAGRAVPFAVDAVSFAAAAVLIGRISIDAPDSPPERDEVASARELIADGWRTVWGAPVLRQLLLLLVGVGFGQMVAAGPIAVYLTDPEALDLGPTGYGAVLSGAAVLAVGSSFAASRIIARFGGFHALLGALIVSLVGFLLMTVQTVATVGVGFGLVLGGLSLGRVVVMAARQRATPSGMHGRVQSIFRAAIFAMASLGVVTGGVLTDQVSVAAPAAVAAGIYAVAIVSLRAVRPTLR